MARRKIAPIPLEIVTDCPGASLLPAAAFGSLIRLVQHFWQSECRPLPANGDRLYALAQAHKPTWANHKAEIMRIFNESAPALAAALEHRQNKINGLNALRERGHAMARKRKLEKAIAAPDASEPVPAPKRDQAAKQAPAAPVKGFTERRAA